MRVSYSRVGVCLCWLLYALSLSYLVDASDELGKADSHVVQVVETEIWDSSSHVWKAPGDARWTNVTGLACSPPSALSPPETFEFDGDWKIVVSGVDDLGWEYSYDNMQPPKRTRVWLRRLQPKVTRSLLPVRKGPFQRTESVAKFLAQMRDDYNFKGFRIYVYKSLISLDTLGIAFGLPISTNFDFLDRRPDLPSLSSSFAFYFPWSAVVFLSTSVHIEWVKWVAKMLVYFVVRLALLVFYKVVLPVLRAFVTMVLLWFQIALPQVPEVPVVKVSKPQYNPELSERIGCSLSYRWSHDRGFEWRVSYWHSILPTLSMYRQLLNMKRRPMDWWQKHFASLGLSSSYPTPIPPHYTCSACFSWSGLFFGRGDGTATETTLVENQQASRSDSTKEDDNVHIEAKPTLLPERLIPARLVAGSKAGQ